MRSIKNLNTRMRIKGDGIFAREKLPSKLDIWLTRAAQAAQVGGIALALFGLYYTVIPLYQKAAVDEQLARANTELVRVEKVLAAARLETYILRRERLMLGLSFSAPDVCAEFREAIGQAQLSEDRVERRKKILQFDTNIAECLVTQVDSIRIRNILSDSDIELLTNNALRLGSELMDERYKLEKRIANLPALARVDSSVLKPHGESVRRIHELQNSWDLQLPPHMRRNRREERLVAQIAWTQELLAQEFRSHAGDRIRREFVPKSWLSVTRARTVDKVPTPERE